MTIGTMAGCNLAWGPVSTPSVAFHAAETHSRLQVGWNKASSSQIFNYFIYARHNDFSWTNVRMTVPSYIQFNRTGSGE